MNREASASASGVPRLPSSTSREHRNDENKDIEVMRSCSLYSSLSKLLQNDKFSDMTIIGGSRTFKVHRAIVCTQSAFFDRALTGDFRRTTSGFVDLPDDDPAVLECFLQYLYTGDYKNGKYPSMGNPPGPARMARQAVASGYPPPKRRRSDPDGSNSEVFPNLSSDDESIGIGIGIGEGAELAATRQSGVPGDVSGSWVHRSLFLPLRLCIMADKYEVPALAVLARNRLYRTAEACWRTCDEFPAFVDELYKHTPPKDLGVREMVCRLVGAGLTDRATRVRMEAVMRKHGDFAVDVMNNCIDSEMATGHR